MVYSFLEFLESDPFQTILPKLSIYFSYIHDTLLIYPHDADLPDLGDQLNKAEHRMKFTYEMVEYNSLTLPMF